jgi:hypothetical protein
MAEIRKFGKLGPRLTFKANEGNLTITTIDTVGGEIPGPVFATPIKDGDYVKLTGNMEVTACVATDTECIGVAVGKPQFKGQQPTVNKTWGNFTPRMVTVELMGAAVRTVTLEAANTKVDAGMMVKLGATTAQRFDKATVENGTRVLVGAAANSGAKIPVLFGFTGLLTRT